jgi:hypothetical protein
MSKVHVLVEYEYGGNDILGVYASEADADAEVARIAAEDSARKAASHSGRIIFERSVGIETFTLIE